MNDIKPWAASLTQAGMTSLLGAMNKINPAMPPFIGNQIEKEALAAYLAEVLGGRKSEPLPPAAITAQDTEIPPFNPAADEYVLLAWPDQGLNMVVESQGVFSLRQPQLALNAQLIKRGDGPGKITDNVKLTYAVEGGAATGDMKILEGRDWYQVQLSIPPRKPDGTLFPYPLATIEARDAATGAVLGRTRAVLPVSDEVACASCHGGADKHGNISAETGLSILRIHDRLNRTKLVAALKSSGKPVQCNDCHADPLSGKEGRGDLLSVSAALQASTPTP